MIALDMIVGAVIFCVVFLVALFVMALFRGARMVSGADAELEARVAAELAAFRRHCDEAMHVGNADDCVMCHDQCWDAWKKATDDDES